jgi:eukaryotic-like serine/threonine-protein kinase
MADRVGQQLGNYRLVRLLGQGGFAEVYLGEHVYIGTQAAIKVLATQLEGQDIEQFRVEATTLAHLEHPHIVRVLDFGVEGTTPFLVMDYAPGGTLRTRHPKGSRLELPLVISYVRQVASALQSAHEQKLIHRDVKPENMLLGRQQEVLLSDFGIALVAQTSRQQLTLPATGTVAYMAPEQIQGKPRPQSDQYSLGIIVYEWLSGTLPFTGSAFELFGQHLHVPPTPLREKVPDIPSAVEQVVMLTLAKDPKERFATVQAFAHALEQASQMETAEMLPAGRSPQPTATLTALSETQQPTQLATALSQSSIPTELATLAEQASVAPRFIAGAQPPSDQPTEANTTEPAGNFPTLAIGTTVAGRYEITQVISESEQEHVYQVYPLEGYQRCWNCGSEQTAPGDFFCMSCRTDLLLNASYLMHEYPATANLEADANVLQGTIVNTFIDQGRTYVIEQPLVVSTASPSRPVTASLPLGTTLYTYRGHSDSVLAVGWSPDGTRIASASSDNTVQVWDAATGKSLLTYKLEIMGSGAGAVAWSPDGTRIALASLQAVVWDAATGKPLLKYFGHGLKIRSWVNAVAWSPDGTFIVSAGNDNNVDVWDAATGKDLFSMSFKGVGRPTAVAWSPDSTRIASGNFRMMKKAVVGVWESKTGANQLIYNDHEGSSVDAVAWSPNGIRIASASEKTVQIWQVATTSTLLTYRGHTKTVNTVAWSSDGTRIASGSADMTVRVWVAE